MKPEFVPSGGRKSSPFEVPFRLHILMFTQVGTQVFSVACASSSREINIYENILQFWHTPSAIA